MTPEEFDQFLIIARKHGVRSLKVGDVAVELAAERVASPPAEAPTDPLAERPSEEAIVRAKRDELERLLFYHEGS